jgi:hypothetical protein
MAVASDGVRLPAGTISTQPLPEAPATTWTVMAALLARRGGAELVDVERMREIGQRGRGPRSGLAALAPLQQRARPLNPTRRIAALRGRW